MINIVYNEANNYFREGVLYLLRDLFKNEYAQDVHFSDDYTTHNIWNADVTIISNDGWQNSICRNELKYRNKGIVVLLSAMPSQPEYKLPACISNDVIFVDRKATVREIYRVIIDAWNSRQRYPHYPPRYSCTLCSHGEITVREHEFLQNMSAGASVSETARKMNVSNKAIYTYKYLIMNKFNLTRNRDFLLFLQQYRQGTLRAQERGRASFRIEKYPLF
ncbi:hypothetical protein ABFP30_001969 [Enterobacter bugandensis]